MHGMQKYFISMMGLLLVCLILTGCGKKTIDQSKTQKRDGLLYEANSKTPFIGSVTGKSFSISFENSNSFEYHYKDGKLDGLFKLWNKKGQLIFEVNYKTSENILKNTPNAVPFSESDKNQLDNFLNKYKLNDEAQGEFESSQEYMQRLSDKRSEILNELFKTDLSKKVFTTGTIPNEKLYAQQIVLFYDVDKQVLSCAGMDTLAKILQRRIRIERDIAKYDFGGLIRTSDDAQSIDGVNPMDKFHFIPEEVKQIKKNLNATSSSFGAWHGYAIEIWFVLTPPHEDIDELMWRIIKICFLPKQVLEKK
jgi:hypothetical protein